ncbi:MAG: exosortase/archaeosortase family protein [Gemmataceae bacterium]
MTTPATTSGAASPPPPGAPRPRLLALSAPLALPFACLLWAYGSTLADLATTWRNNDQYSHGFLVPLFAAFLLWYRRDKLRPELLRPSAWGLVLLGLGLALKLGGAYGYYVSLDPYSLIPCVAGLVLLAGGWAAWRWAWPAVGFLVFMLPLPYFASVAMSGQLQWVATVCSTFVMQTIGLPALAEGNVIHLNEFPINIVEACSGLRMLVVFVALSTAVVLVADRHWIDRGLLLASAVPIAVATNVIRITATGVMYDMGYSDMAKHFFHDFAGWLMPVVALAMLWAEVKLLDALFLDAPRPAASLTPATRRAVPRRVRGPLPPREDNPTGDAPPKRSPLHASAKRR